MFNYHQNLPEHLQAELQADERKNLWEPQEAPHPREDQGVFCDECGVLMEFGEECVELFHGIVGRSRKSGSPMVVDSSQDQTAPAKLHLWCVETFFFRHIYDISDPNHETPPVVCEICSEKIEGADDE